MLTAREIAIKALRENPLVLFTDEHMSRISDPNFDITFDSLGMDSLARMELSIWLEVEFGIEINELQIQQIKSLRGLEDFLDQRLRR